MQIGMLLVTYLLSLVEFNVYILFYLKLICVCTIKWHICVQHCYLQFWIFKDNLMIISLLNNV